MGGGGGGGSSSGSPGVCRATRRRSLRGVRVCLHCRDFLQLRQHVVRVLLCPAYLSTRKTPEKKQNKRGKLGTIELKKHGNNQGYYFTSDVPTRPSGGVGSSQEAFKVLRDESGRFGSSHRRRRFGQGDFQNIEYHPACKLEFEPFNRSYSQLTFFSLL